MQRTTTPDKSDVTAMNEEKEERKTTHPTKPNTMVGSSLQTSSL